MGGYLNMQSGACKRARRGAGYDGPQVEPCLIGSGSDDSSGALTGEPQALAILMLRPGIVTGGGELRKPLSGDAFIAVDGKIVRVPLRRDERSTCYRHDARRKTGL